VSGPFAVALGVLQAVIFAHPAVGIDNMETLVKSLFGLGHTPLFAMALGVVALVVSIIMFAAESTALTSEVWVSCVAVLGSVIGLSLLPITFVPFLTVLLSLTYFQVRKSEELFLSNGKTSRVKVDIVVLNIKCLFKHGQRETAFSSTHYIR
jgi:hypothetical protein